MRIIWLLLLIHGASEAATKTNGRSWNPLRNLPQQALLRVSSLRDSLSKPVPSWSNRYAHALATLERQLGPEYTQLLIRNTLNNQPIVFESNKNLNDLANTANKTEALLLENITQDPQKLTLLKQDAAKFYQQQQATADIRRDLYRHVTALNTPPPKTSLDRKYLYYWNPQSRYYDIDPTKTAFEQAAYNRAHAAYIQATEKLFSATHDPLATKKFMPLAPTPEETKKALENARQKIEQSEKYNTLAPRIPHYLHEFNPFGY